MPWTRRDGKWIRESGNARKGVGPKGRLGLDLVGSILKARGLTVMSLGIAGESKHIYIYTEKYEFPAPPLASQLPTNPSISCSLAPPPALQKLGRDNPLPMHSDERSRQHEVAKTVVKSGMFLVWLVLCSTK